MLKTDEILNFYLNFSKIKLNLEINIWEAKNPRINYEWGDLLDEFPAETRVTIYCRLDILKGRTYLRGSAC